MPRARPRDDRGRDIPRRGNRGGRRPLFAAILHNGLGQYAEALTAGMTAADYDDVGMCGWALVEMVEAAGRWGETAVAADPVRQLIERAMAAGLRPHSVRGPGEGVGKSPNRCRRRIP